jgi:hypothetical protein
LRGERRRAEDEDGPIPQQRRDQRSPSERQRLADADLIGEQQPNAAILSFGLQY